MLPPAQPGAAFHARPRLGSCAGTQIRLQRRRAPGCRRAKHHGQWKIVDGAVRRLHGERRARERDARHAVRGGGHHKTTRQYDGDGNGVHVPRARVPASNFVEQHGRRPHVVARAAGLDGRVGTIGVDRDLHWSAAGHSAGPTPTPPSPATTATTTAKTAACARRQRWHCQRSDRGGGALARERVRRAAHRLR